MSEWSPYGLEAYRTTSSRGRNRWLLAAIALLLLGWLALNLLSGDSSFSVGTGQEGSVVLTRPDDPAPPKATVSVAPGRVTELDQPVETAGSGSRSQSITNEAAYPLMGWALILAPILLLPWLARRLLAGSQTELNFGVYKGAMPLEMISATQRDLVYSRKAVDAPLFGKSREDYIPDEDR